MKERTESALGRVYTPPALAAELVRSLPASGASGATERPLLDPACGDGELLLAAIRSRGLDGIGVRRFVRGFDIDPEACRVARQRIARQVGLEVGELDGVIVPGDALDPATRWPAAAEVVANPPWVSYSGRQSRRPRSSESAGSADPGSGSPWSSERGWPSLHGRFLARIAQHVREARSAASVLLPAAVAELAGYGEVRAAVTSHCTLAGAARELGEDRFPGVTEPAVLIVLEPRARTARGTAAAWTRVSSADARWMFALADCPRLPSRAFADTGVHTGNASKQLVQRDVPAARANLREGRCIHPFRLGAPNALLNTDLRPTQTRYFRVAARERYTNYALLLRQTADRPLAALHDTPTYFRNSVLAVRPVEGLDPGFVAAILNGPVATAWHRASFVDGRQRTFPQVKLRHLRSQPFPIVHREQDPALHDRLAHAAQRTQQRAGEPGHDGRVEQLAALALAAFDLAPEHVEQLRTWL